MPFVKRGGIILSLLLVSNIFVFGLIVNQEIKQQRVYLKVKEPIKRFLTFTLESKTKEISQDILNPTIIPPSPSPQVINRTIIQNKVIITNPTQKSSTTMYTYPSRTPLPTFAPFPTAKPGEPGSPEWDAEFQQKFNQMQQDFAASKEKMCVEHPDLCK